jgi:hypothetical protein
LHSCNSQATPLANNNSCHESNSRSKLPSSQHVSATAVLTYTTRILDTVPNVGGCYARQHKVDKRLTKTIQMTAVRRMYLSTTGNGKEDAFQINEYSVTAAQSHAKHIQNSLPYQPCTQACMQNTLNGRTWCGQRDVRSSSPPPCPGRPLAGPAPELIPASRVD